MKNFKLLFSTLVVFVLIQACSKDEELSTLIPNETTTSRAAEANLRKDIPKREEIDEYLLQKAEKSKENLISWEDAPIGLVHAAMKYSEDVLAIGFKPVDVKDEDLSSYSQKDEKWNNARELIIKTALEEESKYNKKLTSPKELIISQFENFPALVLRISELSTIEKLNSLGVVRYFEPIAYLPKVAETGNQKGRVQSNQRHGCDNEFPSSTTSGLDYVISGVNNAKVSWHQNRHKSQQAWANGARGQGATIAYFDTGVSYDQNLMTHDFYQGLSIGRPIETLGTLYSQNWSYIEDARDFCGHGTSSTSVGVAPNNTGVPSGIAYQAGMVSIKVAYDVVINTPQEIVGVASGFNLVIDRPHVKIVSMSLGTTIVPGAGGLFFSMSSLLIGDAIFWANIHGKVIFSANGTKNSSWMPSIFTVWPASRLDVYSVTGIKEDLHPNGVPKPIDQYTNHNRCDNCMYGVKVNFAVVNQQRAGGNNYAIGLPRRNYTQPSFFGGSSSATASMSAMAALIWSKYPQLTKFQLIRHMRHFCSMGSSVWTPYGWGVLDLNRATLSNQPNLGPI